MGNLVRIPHSELTAVLERLECKGVTQEHLARIRSDEAFRDELAEFLRGERVLAPRVFPTWKTLRTGGVKSAEAFRAALKAAGIQVTDWANDIIGKIVFSENMVEEDVEFVRAFNKELCFPKDATKEDTEKRANELGLEKCSPWDVLAIILSVVASGELVVGQWFLVMMDAITPSDGYRDVFRVERDDNGLWLDASNGSPDCFWSADDVWLFRRKKSLEVKS